MAINMDLHIYLDVLSGNRCAAVGSSFTDPGNDPDDRLAVLDHRRPVSERASYDSTGCVKLIVVRATPREPLG